MLEIKVETYLCEQVKKLGGEVRKVVFVGRRGAPDRLVMTPFHGVALVELKAPGKKAEAHQLREHERLRRMGMRVEVIDTIEGVDKFLGIGEA